MHRRITSSFEFKPPNHLQRERIWDTHTAKAGVPLAGAIDWAEIAIRCGNFNIVLLGPGIHQLYPTHSKHP